MQQKLNFGYASKPKNSASGAMHYVCNFQGITVLVLIFCVKVDFFVSQIF
jgi:hypothetical protein